MIHCAVNKTLFVTNLPSASSCPSTSKRSLFRGFGPEPMSRALLKERSLLFTIWLIFWKRLDSCRWKQTDRVSERTNKWNCRFILMKCSVILKRRCTHPERFPDWNQHSVEGKTQMRESCVKIVFLLHNYVNDHATSQVQLQCYPVCPMWIIHVLQCLIQYIKI